MNTHMNARVNARVNARDKLRIMITIIAFLFLSGCDARIYDHQIRGYNKACENKGGLVLISNIISQGRCNNGDWVDWWEK